MSDGGWFDGGGHHDGGSHHDGGHHDGSGWWFWDTGGDGGSRSSGKKFVWPPSLFFSDIGDDKIKEIKKKKPKAKSFADIDEELNEMMRGMFQDGVFNSLEERVKQRYADGKVSKEQRDAFLLLKENIVKSGQQPMIVDIYTLNDAGKDAVIDAMVKEAMLEDHPLTSDKHPEMPGYAAMMKALGEHLREDGKALSRGKKSDLRQSVAEHIAERTVLSSDGKDLARHVAQEAAEEIYDALGSNDAKKYQEIIDDVAEEAQARKDKNDNTNLLLGGGLLAGGLIAYGVAKSREKERIKQEENPGTPSTIQAKPIVKRSGLSFLGTVGICIGAAITSWALWSKFGPSGEQGRRRA